MPPKQPAKKGVAAKKSSGGAASKPAASKSGAAKGAAAKPAAEAKPAEPGEVKILTKNGILQHLTMILLLLGCLQSSICSYILPCRRCDDKVISAVCAVRAVVWSATRNIDPIGFVILVINCDIFSDRLSQSAIIFYIFLQHSGYSACIDLYIFVS